MTDELRQSTRAANAVLKRISADRDDRTRSASGRQLSDTMQEDEKVLRKQERLEMSRLVPGLEPSDSDLIVHSGVYDLVGELTR
jgi:hypothetical protein